MYSGEDFAGNLSVGRHALITTSAASGKMIAACCFFERIILIKLGTNYPGRTCGKTVNSNPADFNSLEMKDSIALGRLHSAATARQRKICRGVPRGTRRRHQS